MANKWYSGFKLLDEAARIFSKSAVKVALKDGVRILSHNGKDLARIGTEGIELTKEGAEVAMTAIKQGDSYIVSTAKETLGKVSLADIEKSAQNGALIVIKDGDKTTLRMGRETFDHVGVPAAMPPPLPKAASGLGDASTFFNGLKLSDEAEALVNAKLKVTGNEASRVISHEGKNVVRFGTDGIEILNRQAVLRIARVGDGYKMWGAGIEGVIDLTQKQMPEYLEAAMNRKLFVAFDEADKTVLHYGHEFLGEGNRLQAIPPRPKAAATAAQTAPTPNPAPAQAADAVTLPAAGATKAEIAEIVAAQLKKAETDRLAKEAAERAEKEALHAAPPMKDGLRGHWQGRGIMIGDKNTTIGETLSTLASNPSKMNQIYTEKMIQRIRINGGISSQELQEISDLSKAGAIPEKVYLRVKEINNHFQALKKDVLGPVSTRWEKLKAVGSYIKNYPGESAWIAVTSTPKAVMKYGVALPLKILTWPIRNTANPQSGFFGTLVNPNNWWKTAKLGLVGAVLVADGRMTDGFLREHFVKAVAYPPSVVANTVVWGVTKAAPGTENFLHASQKATGNFVDRVVAGDFGREAPRSTLPSDQIAGTQRRLTPEELARMPARGLSAPSVTQQAAAAVAAAKPQKEAWYDFEKTVYENRENPIIKYVPGSRALPAALKTAGEFFSDLFGDKKSQRSAQLDRGTIENAPLSASVSTPERAGPFSNAPDLTAGFRATGSNLLAASAQTSRPGIVVMDPSVSVSDLAKMEVADLRDTLNRGTHTVQHPQEQPGTPASSLNTKFTA